MTLTRTTCVTVAVAPPVLAMPVPREDPPTTSTAAVVDLLAPAASPTLVPAEAAGAPTSSPHAMPSDVVELPAGRRDRSRRIAAVVAAVLTVLVGVPVAAVAEPARLPGRIDVDGCRPLIVVAVDGSTDPVAGTGTGTVSAVDRGLAATAAPGYVDRVDLLYQASVAGRVVVASESIARNLIRLQQTAATVAAVCPQTRIAVAGVGQGAQVASLFAQEIGSGTGTVGPDRVAGVALMSNPARVEGTPLLPGVPEQATPVAAPGTDDVHLAKLASFPGKVAAGAGISPVHGRVPDYGTLAGRVVELCEVGDLMCAAEQDTPLRRVVAVFVRKSLASGADPYQCVVSLAQALLTAQITPRASDETPDAALPLLVAPPAASPLTTAAVAIVNQTLVDPADLEELIVSVRMWAASRDVPGVSASRPEGTDVAGTAAWVGQWFGALARDAVTAPLPITVPDIPQAPADLSATSRAADSPPRSEIALAGSLPAPGSDSLAPVPTSQSSVIAESNPIPHSTPPPSTVPADSADPRPVPRQPGVTADSPLDRGAVPVQPGVSLHSPFQ